MEPLNAWIVTRGATGYIWTLAATQLAARLRMAQTYKVEPTRLEELGYTLVPVVVSTKDNG